MPEEMRELRVGEPRPENWPSVVYLKPRTGLERMKIRKALAAGDEEKALVMCCCMRALNSDGNRVWDSQLDSIMRDGEIGPFLRLGVEICQSDEKREADWLNR